MHPSVNVNCLDMHQTVFCFLPLKVDNTRDNENNAVCTDSRSFTCVEMSRIK